MPTAKQLFHRGLVFKWWSSVDDYACQILGEPYGDFNGDIVIPTVYGRCVCRFETSLRYCNLAISIDIARTPRPSVKGYVTVHGVSLHGSLLKAVDVWVSSGDHHPPGTMDAASYIIAKIAADR